MDRWARYGTVVALLTAAACAGPGRTDEATDPSDGTQKVRSNLYIESDWPLGPFESLPPLKAVTPDGEPVEIPPASQGAWSPDGSSLAFIDPEARILSIASEGDSKHSVFEAPAQAILVYGPTWSPAGDRLAALMAAAEGLQLVVVDTGTGSTATHQLPSAAGKYPDGVTPGVLLFFRWAPDGHHLLLAWGPVLSIDASTGKVVVVSDDPAVAAWGPDGSVYFATISLAGEAGILSRWTPKEGSKPVASSQQLEDAGLDRIFGIVATPSGERMIIASPTQSG